MLSAGIREITLINLLGEKHSHEYLSRTTHTYVQTDGKRKGSG
ncbi:hypothetical protein SAMN04488574_12924 [Bacillus sp. 71mf]|nr:hypothetical protein SAMN04488574_12924 [Bacillus sp. 71mf]SFS53037.1 hypothetical protein SAMN04488145_1011055 [Bacillus sp. 103mf]